jgi:hypothetical protein
MASVYLRVTKEDENVGRRESSKPSQLKITLEVASHRSVIFEPIFYTRLNISIGVSCLVV